MRARHCLGEGGGVAMTMVKGLIRVVLCAAMAAAVFAPVRGVFAQDVVHKAGPQEMPVAIVHATVHTVSGEVIEDGYVFFDGGRILEVGSGERAFIGTTRIIDGRGKHVYPGLIAAQTNIGLIEVSSVRATRDFNETGSVTPEVRAVVAVNPDSTIIPVARSNGVLTAGVFPSGGLVPGRASVVRLDGWTWEEKTILDDCGLIVDWPLMRIVRAGWMDQSEREQLRRIRERVERIEGLFETARAYHESREADPEGTAADIRWEAMGPALRGEKPVFVLANEYDQIMAAVSLAKRHGLGLVIVGGRDAHLCADVLREEGVGVIVRGTYNLPRRSDSDYDEAYRLPALLEEAGVRWCLASGESAAQERNLPFHGGMAAAHGLDPAAAVRAMTLGAAEILGVDDELGSIEAGKAATLIVTTGDVLEVTTRVERAFIDGREVDLTNKQRQLRDKYRERYRQMERGGELGG